MFNKTLQKSLINNKNALRLSAGHSLWLCRVFVLCNAEKLSIFRGPQFRPCGLSRWRVFSSKTHENLLGRRPLPKKAAPNPLAFSGTPISLSWVWEELHAVPATIDREVYTVNITAFVACKEQCGIGNFLGRAYSFRHAAHNFLATVIALHVGHAH